jgi:glutathione synthase/RimK-type ligase-like ATP-grasp enzyme
MKIAIHHASGSFSDRWILYCEQNSIDYKIVDCYKNNIISQLSDCDALMWHFGHGGYREALFAKQLLFSIEINGKKVFPNFTTNWHFDDKVGQKYLFEEIGAPLVPSYVFYSKKEALLWTDEIIYPIVFKLRGGAGSSNVKLVRNKSCARKIINKAFGKGFSQFDGIGYFKDRFNKYRNGNDTFLGVLKGVGRIFITTEYSKMKSREKGYVYFQEFIPNNEFDIRVIVIGEKAFAIKRIVRKNDFRASGGGTILYDLDNFNEQTIKLAFNLAEKIKSQCAAFDFVYDGHNNPLVVEVSYGFNQVGYEKCIGYWDKELNFYEGKFYPQDWMVELLF